MSINTHLYFTCFTSHGKSPESPQPVRSSFPLHPPPHTSMADPVESSGHSDKGWTRGPMEVVPSIVPSIVCGCLIVI